jgi:hypothetical protein
MYMLIRYPVGVIVEAVVLAKNRNRMRVAAAGFPDTIELRRSGPQWSTENRQPIEIDFLMTDARRGLGDSSPKRSTVVRAVGAVTIQQ